MKKKWNDLTNKVVAEKLTTSTTYINGFYYIRLYDDNVLCSEMGCKSKADVGFCCAELLRWYDKTNGVSKMAYSSRNRAIKKKNISSPTNKIIYPLELQTNRNKKNGKTTLRF